MGAIMPAKNESDQRTECNAIAERALGALTVAQLRAAQFDLVHMHLLSEIGRADELRNGVGALGARVRETINSFARDERAAGHSPAQMVLSLHNIFDEAKLNREISIEVEPHLVQWGIEAYFAA